MKRISAIAAVVILPLLFLSTPNATAQWTPSAEEAEPETEETTAPEGETKTEGEKKEGGKGEKKGDTSTGDIRDPWTGETVGGDIRDPWGDAEPRSASGATIGDDESGRYTLSRGGFLSMTAAETRRARTKYMSKNVGDEFRVAGKTYRMMAKTDRNPKDKHSFEVAFLVTDKKGKKQAMYLTASRKGFFMQASR